MFFLCVLFFFFFFFFNDTATTEIYTLSLHDALPIRVDVRILSATNKDLGRCVHEGTFRDRKSTRLNSCHPSISYAVFCLKKKKKPKKKTTKHKKKQHTTQTKKQHNTTHNDVYKQPTQ